MTEEQLLLVLQRLVLILAIAPAAFPFLHRFGAGLRTAAIVLYAVAVGIAIVLSLVYFLG